MKDQARFAPVVEALRSPFSKALKQQQESEAYLEYVEEQFAQLRLIGQDEDDPNAITLARVFVPLQATFDTWHESKHPDSQIESRVFSVEPVPVDEAGRRLKPKVVNFNLAIDGWIKKPDRRDAIRIISGAQVSANQAL